MIIKIPKKHINSSFLYLLVCLLSTTINADNRIVMHLRHAPAKIIQEVKKEAQREKGIKKFGKLAKMTPAQVSQKMVKRELQKHFKPNLSGFIATYGGYMDISNTDGLVSFPLRHVSPKVYVAVTPEIKLINVKGNTLSHKEFIPSEENPTEVYLFEKKEDDKKQTYWDISKVEIPKDKKINPITIVFITHPKNLFIAPGHVITAENEQLVLPDIFVVGNIDKAKEILQMLDIKRFFEAIDIEEKKAGETTVQKLIKNL